MSGGTLGAMTATCRKGRLLGCVAEREGGRPRVGERGRGRGEGEEGRVEGMEGEGLGVGALSAWLVGSLAVLSR